MLLITPTKIASFLPIHLSSKKSMAVYLDDSKHPIIIIMTTIKVGMVLVLVRMTIMGYFESSGQLAFWKSHPPKRKTRFCCAGGRQGRACRLHWGVGGPFPRALVSQGGVGFGLARVAWTQPSPVSILDPCSPAQAREGPGPRALAWPRAF